MNTEELVKLAEAGNLNAMLELADYHFKKDEFIESAMYFEQAAKHDYFRKIVYATLQSSIVGEIAAYTALHDLGAKSDGALDTWKAAGSWTLKAIKYIQAELPGTENTDKDDWMNRLSDTSYYTSVCFYARKQYKKVYEFLSGVVDSEAPRVKILRGLALQELEERSLEGQKKALELMASGVKDQRYALADKDYWEETMYTQAAAIASILYRELYKASGANGMESAVSILDFALNVVKEEDNKNLLRAELGHYQKKFLGGYKYVE